MCPDIASKNVIFRTVFVRQKLFIKEPRSSMAAPFDNFPSNVVFIKNCMDKKAFQPKETTLYFIAQYIQAA